MSGAAVTIRWTRSAAAIDTSRLDMKSLTAAVESNNRQIRAIVTAVGTSPNPWPTATIVATRVVAPIAMTCNPFRAAWKRLRLRWAAATWASR